ncbi:hypothetical protein CC1G_00804 [Coprinopsis cinerea okayama7|uniref:C2H2-type domain-containing protein n=1 Tax=Coprinopsis cinerea (strain Okayama-7 / 130 / ATCC MYA-4618 / FGSC 9003) TaxID=240176 RepID=A8N8S9_COPC7|nr:hypothetical protein CC1G_00804 [Coprinopsis cinerea okayama7\|eukprot:XP_001831257.1 hypothetical protein CC1G_00804 [Coprinopsis cinerea okayama7\
MHMCVNSLDVGAYFQKLVFWSCTKQRIMTPWQPFERIEERKSCVHSSLKPFYALTIGLQFACHLASCPRTFATPKARRLHLISSHGYPKEYFFAVTNKGVGGLLKKWGEGASMIRGKWKPRDGADKPTSRGSGKSYLSNKAMDVDPNTYRDTMDVDSDDSDDDDDDESSSEDETMTREKQPGSRMVLDPEATPRLPLASKPLPAGTPPTTSSPLQPVDPADALTSGFSSLSLVPPAVRFGRGGRNTGFAARIDKPTAPTPEQPLDAGTQMSSNHLAAAQRGRGGGKANTHNTSTAHEIAPVQSQAVPDRMRTRGRGRGIGRGRGY